MGLDSDELSRGPVTSGKLSLLFASGSLQMIAYSMPYSNASGYLGQRGLTFTVCEAREVCVITGVILLSQNHYRRPAVTVVALSPI